MSQRFDDDDDEDDDEHERADGGACADLRSHAPAAVLI